MKIIKNRKITILIFAENMIKMLWFILLWFHEKILGELGIFAYWKKPNKFWKSNNWFHPLILILWNYFKMFKKLFNTMIVDWQSGSSFVLGIFFRILPNLDLSLVYNLSFEAYGVCMYSKLFCLLIPGWWWWSKHESHAMRLSRKGVGQQRLSMEIKSRSQVLIL